MDQDETLTPEQQDSSEDQASEPSSELETESPVSREELLALLEQREREASEYLSDLQRLQAEFANYRKRVDREREELVGRASESLLLRVVEVVDNLERAVASDASGDGLREGVEAVLRMILKALEDEGVKPIEALGESFDPSIHMAVMTEVSEEHPEDTVIAELQRGYIVGERVLRPAMVRVSRKS